MRLLNILAGDLRDLLAKYWPTATVLVVVMLLLRGVAGTVEAIKMQAAVLVTCVFGHGDDVAGVVAHTLPLALAAALATFVIASGKLEYDSISSVTILACTILLGMSLGGLLRSILPEPELDATLLVENASPANSTASESNSAMSEKPIVGIATHAGAVDLSEFQSSLISHGLLPTSPTRPRLPPAQPVKDLSPLEQLQQVDWFAPPQLSRARSREIRSLNLLPKATGVAGLITKTINQILGFLIAYQPRLFCAAIISGSWLGWSWHRKLKSIHERVLEDAVDELTSEKMAEGKPTLRSAA